MSWNLLSKRNNPTASFFLVAVTASTFALSPLLWLYRSALERFPPALWTLLFFTGFAETVYFVSLAGAYRKGTLSLAYPLARAAPVVLVAVFSLLMGREAQFTMPGLMGMFLVAAGCVILPLREFRQVRLSNYINQCTLFALGAALGTTMYTLIDNRALQIMREAEGLNLVNFQIPLLYLQLQSLMTSIGLALFVLLNKDERLELPVILQKYLRPSIAAGFLSSLAYFFVLIAMANVRDISYISAFRQLSVPIGAILGIRIQKEPAYATWIFGIFVVSIGLIMVALG